MYLKPTAGSFVAVLVKASVLWYWKPLVKRLWASSPSGPFLVSWLLPPALLALPGLVLPRSLPALLGPLRLYPLYRVAHRPNPSRKHSGPSPRGPFALLAQPSVRRAPPKEVHPSSFESKGLVGKRRRRVRRSPAYRD